MDAVVNQAIKIQTKETRDTLAEKSKEMGENPGAKRKNQAKRSEILKLLEKQEYKCALSGRELTPDNSELDHIIPVTTGGSNAIENIQIVTKEINRMKGSMTNDQFIEACQRVAEWCR